MEGRVRTAVAATTSGDAADAADDGDAADAANAEVNSKKPVLEQPSITFGYTTSSR